MDVYGKKKKMQIHILNEQVQKEHSHQHIELLYVLEGTLEVRYGKQLIHMRAEDVFVINAGQVHELRGSDNILYTSLMIEYQMLTDVFQTADAVFWCNSTDSQSERYEELRTILRLLLKHYLETRGNTENFGHYALCYRVLDILSMYFLVHKSDAVGEDNDRFEERLAQINQYIYANYDQPISMKDLSEKLYLSNGYLSRFFKKNYGMSFAEYLTGVRLRHAMDDLLYSNTPITRIAFNNGFASMAIFNKAFKKAYHSTPSAVRKKTRSPQKTDEGLQDLAFEARLEQILVLHPSEKDTAGEIGACQATYSVRDTKELQNSWGNLINIGTASDLLKSEIREHIVLLKDTMGFTHVRFWNLFSKDMLISGQGGEESYNFTRLDSILDFLQQLGVKPHIELGMKPWKIMRNVASNVVEETENEDFASSEQWEGVVDAMMRHLLRRYGQRELNGWRMELWFNERKWDEQTASAGYFNTFNITYRTIKKYCGGIEVGGCGLRMDFGEQAMRRFLSDWTKQEFQPDFVSIILYPYDRGELRQDSHSKRSTDNEYMKHKLKQGLELLDSVGLGRGSKVKLYITEWNLTASERNFMNDTCFKGAYIIKNVLDMYGMADDIGYFVGSDRTSEHHDSGEVLHGGTGIVTRDGVLKPAGFAFEFLKRLYPHFVAKGENFLISTDCHDSYGIVCHNQMPLSYNYYFTKEDGIEKDHLWKYYEKRNNLELDLTLTDVTDGLYQVKAYSVNEQNGCAMTIWKEMEWEKELSRNDIKYFQRMCEPKLTIQQCEAKSGTLNLHIHLQPNEIAFIRIRVSYAG